MNLNSKEGNENSDHRSKSKSKTNETVSTSESRTASLASETGSSGASPNKPGSLNRLWNRVRATTSRKMTMNTKKSKGKQLIAIKTTTICTTKETESNPHKLLDVQLNPTQKQTLADFIRETCTLGVSGLLAQYSDSVRPYKAPDFQHKAFDQNPKKNRYKDVFCLDRTRVVLAQESDYIHANRVKGYDLENDFICAQAPMKGTVDDFWEMIVQENVASIFMLCNVFELGKKKCHEYWPVEENGRLTFNSIDITNLSVDNADTTFVTTVLLVEKNAKKIFITHMLWKNWGEIIGVAAKLLMVQVPIIAMYISVDCRANCIQTSMQYAFVAKCLMAYGWQCGIFTDFPDLVAKFEKFDNDYKETLTAEKEKPTNQKGALAGSPNDEIQCQIAENP